MREEKIIMFKNRLVKVAKHVSRQAKQQGVSCYRVYDHDLPEFPFCIERYDDKLYVAEYHRRHGMTDAEHAQWLNQSIETIEEVLQVPKEKIFVKKRQRKPGRKGQYRKQAEAKQEFIVTENGLQFIVNLSDYLDTGLFLDHRLTRQRVKEQSSGKKVLNLFAYTGSFSVYAAAGGAEEVFTVDLSKTYLNWAERNMKLNDFNQENRYKYIQADVKQFLENMSPQYYDIIIMDPPVFSNSKRMEGILDVQQDHVMLINQCLAGLKKNGLLIFSTNLRSFTMEKEKIYADIVKDITKTTTPFDFTGKIFRKCYEIRKQVITAAG